MGQADSRAKGKHIIVTTVSSGIIAGACILVRIYTMFTWLETDLSHVSHAVPTPVHQ